MTEWEKLLAGEVYNDFDPDLFARRVKAKKLFRSYNATEDEETTKRQEILSALLGSLGERVWIEPDFRCEYGVNISIGDDVYINFGCIILDCSYVSIGEHTLIGPNVGIYTANHCLDTEERIHGGCFGRDVHIGKNCWIGGDCKILQGVTIGDNSIIGTGSIVTRDIPSGVIAVGSPCHVLRPVTDADRTGYTW